MYKPWTLFTEAALPANVLMLKFVVGLRAFAGTIGRSASAVRVSARNSTLNFLMTTTSMINSILVFAFQHVGVPYKARRLSMRGKSIWKENNIMQTLSERKKGRKMRRGGCSVRSGLEASHVVLGDCMIVCWGLCVLTVASVVSVGRARESRAVKAWG